MAYSPRQQIRKNLQRARQRHASGETLETITAGLTARMAESIEETRRKSEALLKRCYEAGVIVRNGKPVGGPLPAQLAYEFATARLWHIEHGVPLPPFSNGNYSNAMADDVASPEMRLINEGHRQLREAWIRGTE
jgi:hypothetical protein